MIRLVEVRPKRTIPSGPRIYKLRSYRRVAFYEHTCHWCYCSIEPGDEYEAEVTAFYIYGDLLPGSRRKGISVWKKHVQPTCPRNPFEEEREDLEDARPDEMGNAA